MTVKIIRISTSKQENAPKKKNRGHTVPQTPPISLNEPGRLRVAHLQALLGGISHSAFYSRLQLGHVPPPDGRDPRPYWRTETVKLFLQQ